MGDENKGLTFDKSLFVIYISILFYLSAYSYKSGYLSFYKVPTSFILVDFSTLLNISVPIIGLIVILILMLDILFIYFPKKGSVVKKGFMSIGFLIPINALLNYIFGWNNGKYFIWILILFLIIEFGVPLFCFKKEALNYWGKYNKLWSRGISFNPTPNPDRSDFHYWIIDNFGIAFFNAFWILYLSTFLLTSYGKNIASQETLHNVLNTKPEMIVIDVRGNEMVCKPFDRLKKTFGNDFFILKEADYSNYPIRSVNIGKLTFEESLTK